MLLRAAVNHALARAWYPLGRPRRRVPRLSIPACNDRASPMHRFFGLLALAAAGLGIFLLFGPEPEPNGSGAQALQQAPVAYSGWALGLVMGLMLAWLAGVDWSLPAGTRGRLDQAAAAPAVARHARRRLRQHPVVVLIARRAACCWVRHPRAPALDVRSPAADGPESERAARGPPFSFRGRSRPEAQTE